MVPQMIRVANQGCHSFLISPKHIPMHTCYQMMKARLLEKRHFILIKYLHHMSKGESREYRNLIINRILGTTTQEEQQKENWR